MRHTICFPSILFTHHRSSEKSNRSPLSCARIMFQQLGAYTSGSGANLRTALFSRSWPPKNVIFILSDDHRYDFMGFTEKVPWLKTPNLDRMAQEGAYFANAFLTTSLCSPSRASILTGLYSHTHTIIDNQAPDPGNLTFFPQYLQAAGYQTGFFGKWHMGSHGDDP